MYEGKTISIVMPAYNEDKSIGRIVEDFKSSQYVDEVIVIDNNSKDKTALVAEEKGAKVVKETNQGYGYACRRALAEARSDYIVLVESDDTFTAKDLIKFLAYTEDFDFIQGTRTTKELIGKSANMNFFLKWGNWLVAKLLQVLYNGPSLSDMGCTYRLIKKDVLKLVQPHFYVGGSAFLANMTISALKKHVRMIEISVNYRQRKGESKITGSFLRTISVGLNMIGIIFIDLFKRY
ncbi:MAG: glycosyltransferase family 2 protein [Candidatus Omnitrophota bacterium]